MLSHDEKYQQLKRCAARYVYPRRHMKIMHKGAGDRYRKKITWRDWWSQKFNDNFDRYVTEQVQLKNDKNTS